MNAVGIVIQLRQQNDFSGKTADNGSEVPGLAFRNTSGSSGNE